MSPYREVEHTADWALHVWAPTLAALFADAAQGMYALAGAEPKAGPALRRKVQLGAEDPEALLVAWLQELLFLAETEGLAFRDVEFEALDSSHLRATVVGGPTERVTKPIKAVTFHDLRIRRTAQGYETTIVFDV